MTSNEKVEFHRVVSIQSKKTTGKTLSLSDTLFEVAYDEWKTHGGMKKTIGSYRVNRYKSKDKRIQDRKDRLFVYITEQL